MFFSKGDKRADKVEDPLIFFEKIPIKPVELIVLDIGIIIALARVANFISHDEHRSALREKEGEEKIAHLLLAKMLDNGVIAWSLGAAIPVVIAI